LGLVGVGGARVCVAASADWSGLGFRGLGFRGLELGRLGFSGTGGTGLGGVGFGGLGSKVGVRQGTGDGVVAIMSCRPRVVLAAPTGCGRACEDGAGFGECALALKANLWIAGADVHNSRERQ
jgi:hypothetical protein